MFCPQEVAQLVGTTPHEVEVTSSNPLSPSYVDMSKKKKKNPYVLIVSLKG
jgi:hypothetical protein